MAEGSGSRLAAVLKNVITTEINLRTADLTIAEQNINTVREYLNKTRQAVCADFYDDNFKTTLQKPAHRAVKKTFAGKTPIKQEPLEYDHCPQSSSSPWSSGSQLLDSKKVNYETCDAIKEEPPDSDDTDGLKNTDADEDPQPKYLDPDEKCNQTGDVEKRRPRYIPPVIPINQIQHSLKPRGDKTMKKVRFLVRNNSKYILTPEDSSGATHKWSLNVKLNDESMDISQIVSKVVFYLHPSYKPHDVVTVHSAPFKITRRGWGEFDLRIKIFFINDKNEPAAVTHPLVFDKLHSGMETFGGETIFDHWINEPSVPTSVRSMDQIISKRDESNISVKIEQPSPPGAAPLSTMAHTNFDDFSTLPFNNETSKHFLSAIFGEPEVLSAAKKDWEQLDDLFNLDDLAFPEFFGANDQKLGLSGKTRDGDLQPDTVKVGGASESVTDTVLDPKSGDGQSVSAVITNSQDREMSENKSPVHVDSFPTDSITTTESTCDTVASSSEPESSSAHASKVVTSVCESSLQDDVCNVSADPVENVEREVFLSDLSEFGDEVIIMDSNDDQSDGQRAGGVENHSSSLGKNSLECGGVDYSSVEMDDLIKFPTEKPSNSGTKLQKTVTNSCSDSPVYVVATSKASAVSHRKASRGSGVTKAPPQSALIRTVVNSVRKPRTSLLVTSSNQHPIVTNKYVTNNPPTTLIVSSSDISSITTSKCVASNSPTTLLVSSSNLHSISNPSPKCLPTVVAPRPKSSIKTSNRTVVRKVASPRNPNTNILTSMSGTQGGTLVNLPSTSRVSLQSSVSAPIKTSITSATPVAISAGQPITLLSLLNTSSASAVSKNAPIVISSPKVGSQSTPTLLVPSSMILKPAFTKTVTSAIAGQVNSAVQPQTIHLASKTKGNKIAPNVMKMAPAQVGVRPGGTRFLVKMPDGTLKPINLETLTPLKPSEFKISNPVPSGVRPQPILLRAPIATSVLKASPQSVGLKGMPIRGKRSTPAPTVPAKRRKTELSPSSSKVPATRSPIILSGSPQLVFKLPQSPNQLLVVPQAANQPVIRLPESQVKLHSSPIPISNKTTAIATSPAVIQHQTAGADPEIPSNQIPKPEAH
uniref:YEATS domain-containing protein 2 n=1 Tax=Lygus hesperus TaxID=30085 RepID=A0A0A9Y8J5_LYGHE